MFDFLISLSLHFTLVLELTLLRMLVLVGLELGALDELAENDVRLDPQLVVLVFHLLKLIHFLRPRHLLQ